MRLDLAYALNMHMAEGITTDKAITVMDSHEREYPQSIIAGGDPAFRQHNGKTRNSAISGNDEPRWWCAGDEVSLHALRPYVISIR